MTVALGTNIANPISTALSQWPGFDTMGKLANYGKLGATDPDAVIKALFANNEVGAWYDPSDLTTMFQDRAGTTPVTADGQTVGKILDKSGRGNHAVAPSDAARPLYKTAGGLHWLLFDGVDDNLQKTSINFSASDKLSATIGLSVDGTGNQGFYATGSGGAGTCSGLFLAGASPVNRASLTGNSAIAQISTPALGAAPQKYVVSHIHDLAGASATDEIKNRQNGALGTQTVVASGPAGSGNLSASSYISVGDANISTIFPFSGKLFSFVLRGALSTTQEITDTETWVNSKTGAY